MARSPERSLAGVVALSRPRAVELVLVADQIARASSANAMVTRKAGGVSGPSS